MRPLLLCRLRQRSLERLLYWSGQGRGFAADAELISRVMRTEFAGSRATKQQPGAENAALHGLNKEWVNSTRRSELLTVRRSNSSLPPLLRSSFRWRQWKMFE